MIQKRAKGITDETEKVKGNSKILKILLIIGLIILICDGGGFIYYLYRSSIIDSPEYIEMAYNSLHQAKHFLDITKTLGQVIKYGAILGGLLFGGSLGCYYIKMKRKVTS